VDLDTIATWLYSRERRATYGAVAGILGKTARELMSGHPPRNHKYSWIVALTTRSETCTRPDGTPFQKPRSTAGWPTGYKHRERDRNCCLQARAELDNVLNDGATLQQWLDDRRRICSGIKHRGMRLRYECGDPRPSQIGTDLREGVRDFLLKVDSATTLQDFGKIHPLKGRKGVWSVVVKGNWRITFRFNSCAFDIDSEDYHKGRH